MCFKSGALRRVFGPKKKEVKGDWRNLHNEELHYCYSLPNIRTKCRWEVTVKMDRKEIGWQDVAWTHLAHEMDTQ